VRNLHQHIALYVFEIIILGIGFIVILNADLSFWAQLVILLFMLFFYIAVGLIRHTKDHDMHGKVMLEYISISIIVILIFFLINISRI